MGTEPGQVFGDYRIDSILGRGGMGTVYLARDERLGRRVALKLLSAELGDQPAFRDRFIRESRTAASLDHPHIVPIYEAGEVDGQPFIAMRYVEGTDLDRLLREQGALPPARAARLVAQVADALDAAHHAGLIHRDVKPGNVLVASTSAGEDHAYLSDFGLTKAAAYGAGVTRTGQVVGTVDYVAPEQIEGRTIDHRVDVYSLGCMLFELLTGAPPFHRDSEVAVLFAHVQAPVPSARDARPELPDGIDAVIERACAKDPADRFETAGELARAAQEALAPETRSPEAGTHGFLFADLRGYTDFVERHGDEAAAALLDRYRRMVREVVARQAGAEVRTEGDSFYVLFPSASRAVVAGLEIVAEAKRRAADTPDAPIHVGVGIHAGETAETAEGPVGSAVNLAARICAQARIGEVLVSDTVRGLTRTRQIASFEAAGSRRLKGIAEPMPLYRALAPGTAIGAGRRPPLTPIGRLRDRGSAGRWMAAGAGLLVVGGIGGFALLGGFGGLGADPSGSSGPSAGSASLPVDGTRIIYSRQISGDGATPCDEFPAEAKLYVLDPDDPGAAPFRLTYASDLIELDPAWSADGRTIAFVGSNLRGPGGIAVVDPAGEQVRMVLPPRTTPGIGFFASTRLSVAPDGSAIVHADEGGAFHTSVASSDMQRFAGQPPPDEPTEEPIIEEFVRDAAHRADGSLLLLWFNPIDGESWLETAAGDGSDRVRIEPNLDLEGPARMALGPDDDTLIIEREGAGLLIGRLSDGPESFTPLDLDLTAPQHAAFSPDGTELVVQAGNPTQEELYRLDIQTGEVVQLTNDPETAACTPAWQAAPANLAQPRPTPEPDEPLPFELGKLEPAEYLNTTVQPPMSLTFGDGWFARRSYVDGWSVHVLGTAGEVDYGRVQVGLSGPCFDSEEILIGPRPSDVITWLQSREDLEVSPPSAINLGGHPGVTVDIEGREGEACPDDPDFGIWALFHIGEDTDSVVEGEQMRLVALDVRGTTHSFQIYSFDGKIDEYWSEYAQPLLATLSFPEE